MIQLLDEMTKILNIKFLMIFATLNKSVSLNFYI